MLIAYILRAMDYIEDLSFIGFKETETQSLQWPRVNVVIDGFGLDASTIPDELKVAVYEAVKQLLMVIASKTQLIGKL